MTQETSPVVADDEPFRVPVLNLLRLAVPAVVVGIVSALTLLGLSRLAGLLEHWVWDDLSAAVGVSSDSAVWIIGVLTATGLLDRARRPVRAGARGPGPGDPGAGRGPAAAAGAPRAGGGARADARGWGQPGPGEPDHRHQRRPRGGARDAVAAEGEGPDLADDGRRGDHRRDVRHARRGGAAVLRAGPGGPSHPAVGPAVPAAGRGHRGVPDDDAAGEPRPGRRRPRVHVRRPRRPRSRGRDRGRLRPARPASRCTCSCRCTGCSAGSATRCSC